MKVINTTKDEIKVSILGAEYVLEPEGELEGVPADHAEYWVTKLHQFLTIEPEAEDKAPVIGSDEEEAKAEAEAKAAEEAAKKEEEAADKKEDKKEDAPKEEKKEDKKEEKKDK